ncbi:uncharacterized protein LOC133200483, partial [Saccostrea echinata]|uniref:uncharacterized protein LOC133200483 n=1 Tax=Saccostrea echinata TaxID=191078 RepID=UPI002A824BE0
LAKERGKNRGNSFFFLSKAITSRSPSCHASRDTILSVSNCPRAVKDWQIAVERKKCSSFARRCSDPDKLVYHCVINPFHNESLEVCAYPKIIHHGFCAEYSYSANIIQQSIGTNCTHLNNNSCPVSYNSTDAYKYTACYDLVKKIPKNKETSMMSTPVSTITTSDEFL